MTNNDKLEALIQKAIDGGWEAEGLGGAENWVDIPLTLRQSVIHTLLTEGEGNGYMLFIFNHDFAKAIWGEGHNCNSHPETDVWHGTNLGWRHHLQKAVISDDPISYTYGAVFDYLDDKPKASDYHSSPGQ